MEKKELVWINYREQYPKEDKHYLVAKVDGTKLRYDITIFVTDYKEFFMGDDAVLFWAELPVLPDIKVSYSV